MSLSIESPLPQPPFEEASTDAGHVVPMRPGSAPQEPPALDEAIAGACERIPPLWTLRNFVAVNPFMGFRGLAFADAMEAAERLFHGRTWMPSGFYRAQLERGRIEPADLDQAIDEALAADPGAGIARAGAEPLRTALLADGPGASPAPGRVETVADALDRLRGSDWARFVTHEVSKWCAGRFDAGQAAWPQPWAELPLFEAWRAAARIDRNPEIRGLRGFRAYVASLPATPRDAIAAVLAQLAAPAAQHAELLTRELASIAGWAGHVQARVREAAFAGERDEALVHLLAVRLAFDGALHRAFLEPGSSASEPNPGERTSATEPAAGPSEPERQRLWQRAYELGYRRTLLSRLVGHRPAAHAPPARPRLQAVFCIDVRSEVLRRHLEAQSDEVQTLGFAGFFGFPIEYQRVGDEQGTARCPALLAPPYRLRERAPDGSPAEARVRRARSRHARFTGLRKLGVGTYPLVETVGHFFGLRLLTDALGWTRPHDGGALFRSRDEDALGPDATRRGGSGFGLDLSEQVHLAEGALRNMGLTRSFGDVVLLCGHGSLSTNNPYASSLDCGACGGHRGDVNARVAAAVLGSPAVRNELAKRGIEIPAETVFVAGLHDTTRDTVTLLDADTLPPALRRPVEGWLAAACRGARQERATALGEQAGADLARQLQRRATDWSEIRPEWGLAGNAAFVAAPRARTRGLDLAGRVFLHDYDPASDPDGDVLELILTAPLIVASWINLQYYASTTDNDVFGSGDKTLHNVVGRHGVVLGNRSDLQVGLPWQSVHDGTDYRHEPMRLTAIVEAPRERIESILGAHPDLRETLEHGWVHLLAWEPDADRFHRFLGLDRGWEIVPNSGDSQ